MILAPIRPGALVRLATPATSASARSICPRCGRVGPNAYPASCLSCRAEYRHDLFPTGEVEASPRAARLLADSGRGLDALVQSHALGDDGEGVTDGDREWNAESILRRQGSVFGSFDVAGVEVVLMTLFNSVTARLRGALTRVCLADEADDFLVQPADLAPIRRRAMPPPVSEIPTVSPVEESTVSLATTNGQTNRVQAMIPDRPFTQTIESSPPAPLHVTAETISAADRATLRELVRVQLEEPPVEIARQFLAETNRTIHPLRVRHICTDLPMPPGKPRTEGQATRHVANKKAARHERRQGSDLTRAPLRPSFPALALSASDPIGVCDAILDALESLNPSDRPRVLAFIAKRFPAA